MDRHHDMTFAPLLMLVPIKPTSLFTQPIPECRAFHRMLLEEKYGIARGALLRRPAGYHLELRAGFC
jgi:hypothetical protein